MSYVLNGVYYHGDPPKREQHDGYKSWHRDRQREDHRKDLVQPYKDGRPNEEFMQAYPEQSKKYGFIPEENNNGKY